VLNKADNDRKGDGADEELEQHTLQERLRITTTGSQMIRFTIPQQTF
jgi:hypothetical protein